MVLEVCQKVEEGLFGSIKVRFWLHNAYRVCWEKHILDLWKYFLGVECRLWKYSQGSKMGLEVITKVEESLKWFNEGWILAARCL